MSKEELINSLIIANDYVSYLEIGVQNGYCYKQINAYYKTAVDINYTPNIPDMEVMTSDNYFRSDLVSFDLIFIDGLHEAAQVMTDIVNSAGALNEGGTIVIHDIFPTSELTQRVPRESKEWYGDVWKCWYLLLKSGYNITLTTHDFDCGIGVMTLKPDGLDDLLCSFSDNIEKLNDLKYNEHYAEFLNTLTKS